MKRSLVQNPPPGFFTAAGGLLAGGPRLTRTAGWFIVARSGVRRTGRGLFRDRAVQLNAGAARNRAQRFVAGYGRESSRFEGTRTQVTIPRLPRATGFVATGIGLARVVRMIGRHGHLSLRFAARAGFRTTDP